MTKGGYKSLVGRQGVHSQSYEFSRETGVVSRRWARRHLVGFIALGVQVVIDSRLRYNILNQDLFTGAV
jgi:hypothetical protein